MMQHHNYSLTDACEFVKLKHSISYMNLAFYGELIELDTHIQNSKEELKNS